MIPTIDKMLSLTADIAEELLILKDADKDMLPADLKLKIIQLAELAATSETEAPQPVEANTDVPEAETVKETAPEPVLEPAPEPEPVDKPEPELESASAPEPEPEPEPIPSELEAGFAALEAAIENAKEPEPVEAKTAVQEEPNVEAVEAVEAIEPESAAPERFIEIGALQKAFSINDLFFFRREIFGGSKQAFDAMLDRVSVLSDRRMLQEYLVEELNLNLNQTPGKDLYHILVAFFR